MTTDDTILDNAPKFDEGINEETALQEDIVAESEVLSAEPEHERRDVLKSVAAGLGSGILVGSLATLLSSGTTDPEAEQPGGGELSHPEWTDGHVDVATSVNDSMSFGEAFAAARAEVGAGGVFEWHGNIYSTFTAEEWSSMTPAERDEYGSHFSWHSSHHDTADNHSGHGGHDDVVAQHDGQPAQHHEPNAPGNDPNVHPAGNTTDDDVDIQVLGVTHDDETGANIGTAVIGGHQAVFVDADNDHVFDVLAVDVNDNGSVDEGEMVDISENNITVDDLGGFVGTNDGMMQAHADPSYDADMGESPIPTDDALIASNDIDVDYTNDAVVYEA